MAQEGGNPLQLRRVIFGNQNRCHNTYPLTPRRLLLFNVFVMVFVFMTFSAHPDWGHVPCQKRPAATPA
jgi:hypothetical protein